MELDSGVILGLSAVAGERSATPALTEADEQVAGNRLTYASDPLTVQNELPDAAMVLH